MKNKFIQSTLILIIGGFFTKILGMFIRIIMARKLGSSGMGLYTLIMPTFSLFIALSQFGLPIAISKLVSEGTYNNKNVVFSIFPFILSFNLFLLFLLYFLSPFISTTLLHEERCIYALMAMGFTLPFIAISSILRGYFFGKERMIPHVVSNIVEDIIRLIILFFGIPLFMKKGLEYAILFVVLSNVVSEITSILVLFFFLPKNFQLRKEDLKPQKQTIKNVFHIGIPTTGSRIIGSIGYFLEPIILTSTLLHVGYSQDFIVQEYGILNGYVMPLLLLPSFFTMAISQALLPIVSKHHACHNFSYAKHKIHQGLFFSLFIGVPVTILFIFFPEVPLQLLYHTSEGISYIKFLAPICLFHYVQAIFSSSLQAMGKANISMTGTLIGTFIRTLTLFLFSLLHIGIYGLIIATGINMIFVTLYDGYFVYKELKTCP